MQYEWKKSSIIIFVGNSVFLNSNFFTSNFVANYS